MKKGLSAGNMALCSLFIVLITAGAYLRIPVPPVPITLQYFMTVMAGLLLGPKLGSISVLIYVVMGLLGVPVFSSGGGLGYIVTPSFGFLLGFVIGTWLTGRIAGYPEKPGYARLAAAAFCGMAAVYAIGTVYCWIITAYYLGTPLGFWPMMLSCVVLPMPKDIVLNLFAAYLAKRLLPSLLHKNK